MLRPIAKLFSRSQPTEEFVSPSPAKVPYIDVTPWTANPAIQSFDGTVCEVCGIEGVPVLYGLRPAPPEDVAVIGGCTISPGMPRYACTNCGTRWNVGDEDFYVTFRKLIDHM
jgi:hypothetical protein